MGNINYREVRRLSRNAEYRRILISEVNMGQGFIVGRDVNDNPIRVNLDFQNPIVAIPAQGEMWSVNRHENEWRLDRRMEDGSETKTLASLGPGDRRVEATADLHLSGSTINLDGSVNIDGPVTISGVPIENVSVQPVERDGALIGIQQTLDFETNFDPSIFITDDPANSRIIIALGNLLPAGITVPYAGAIVPIGWAWAKGEVVPIGQPGSTYYRLWQAVQTLWNLGGEPAGYFRMPDTQGYVIAGQAGVGGHSDMTTIGAHSPEVLANRRVKHSHGVGTLAIAASGGHIHTFGGTAAVITGGAHGHTFTGTPSTTGAGSPHNHGITDNGHAHSFGSSALYAAGTFAGPQTPMSGGFFATNTAFTGITINNESAHTHSFTAVGTISSGDTHTHNYTPAGTIATNTHVHATGDFTGAVGTTSSAPSEGPSYVVMPYIVKL